MYVRFNFWIEKWFNRHSRNLLEVTCFLTSCLPNLDNLSEINGYLALNINWWWWSKGIVSPSHTLVFQLVFRWEGFNSATARGSILLVEFSRNVLRFQYSILLLMEMVLNQYYVSHGISRIPITCIVVIVSIL